MNLAKLRDALQKIFHGKKDAVNDEEGRLLLSFDEASRHQFERLVLKTQRAKPDVLRNALIFYDVATEIVLNGGRIVFYDKGGQSHEVDPFKLNENQQ